MIERGRTPLLARRRRTSIRQVFLFRLFPCPFSTKRGVNMCTARGKRNVEHHTLYRYTRDPQSTTKSRIRFTKTKRATETANCHTLINNRTQAEAAIY